jgi:hypothetical protein
MFKSSFMILLSLLFVGVCYAHTWDVGNICNSDTVGDSSCQVDSNNEPHVVWVEHWFSGGVPYGHLHYMYHTGGSWTSPENIYGAGENDARATYPSLALDSGNMPHVCWYEEQDGGGTTTQVLKYAYKDANGWHLQTVDSQQLCGAYCSIALDSNDKPHIAYYDERTTPDHRDLKYAVKTGASWVIMDDVDSSGAVGLYADIEITSGDRPFITYYTESNNKMKYAYYDHGWSIGTIDSGTSKDIGKWGSLKIDSNHVAHVAAYCVDDHSLVYNSTSGGTWGSWVTVDDPVSADVGKATSIDVNGNYIAIAYYDDTNVRIKYAENGGGGWSKEVIDYPITTMPSLSLTSGGNPRISYGKYDALNNNYDLWMASYTSKGKLLIQDNESKTQAVNFSLDIRPLPARDVISCAITTSIASKVELKLYDLSGRLVQTHETFAPAGECIASLDASHMSNGAYILIGTCGSNKISHNVVVAH